MSTPIENFEYAVTDSGIDAGKLFNFFSFMVDTAESRINPTYGMKNSGIVIEKYCGTDSVVVIPQKIDGLPVTKIDREAFRGDMTEVYLPDGLEMIDNRAFTTCNLEKIQLPDSLLIIGDAAFNNCKNLNSICLPKSLKLIGEQTFRGCKNLKALKIPEGLLYADERAFAATGLTSAYLPDSLLAIRKCLFESCYDLEEVHLPHCLQKIGEGAFWNCKNLKEIWLPESVSSIGCRAFFGCENLRRFNFPSNLHYIDWGVLSCCKNLSAVYVPKILFNRAFGDKIKKNLSELPEGCRVHYI